MSKIKIQYIKDFSSIRIQVDKDIYQELCAEFKKQNVTFIEKDDIQGQQIHLEDNEIQARTYPNFWNVLKNFTKAHRECTLEIAPQSENQGELQSLLEKHKIVEPSSSTMSRDSAASNLAKKAKAPCCFLFGFFFGGAITKSVSGAVVSGALLGAMAGGNEPDDSEQRAAKKIN